ncbi:MAG: FAD-dependent monooxygenase [Reyranellaceae bacterium]
MTAPHIIVIGAGIGGLAASLALQRRGFKASVYERGAEIREFGAGVVIAPNARRALRDLGVDEALQRASCSVPIMHTCAYDTGEIIKTTRNDEVAARQGMGVLQVHRGDLHGLLLEGVRANDPDAVHADHTFVSLEQDSYGVTVTFANGARARGDAAIGADGITSAVRSFLFPGETPKFTGQVAFRALIPEELVPPGVRQRGSAMHPAPRRYLLHYPLRGGRVMNLIGCGQALSWEEEGWSIPATNEEFLRHYSDFAPEILELIRNVPPGALFKWGLRDREPLPTWTQGRVAMLGDAAHPMTPFLGQGACMALEDSLLLGRAFAAAQSVEEALARYEGARRTRGTNVQLWSREEGRALQDPTRERRTALDRGLYDYDPVTVPV